MRERHFPRLCRSCDAPMARQQNGCWRCEAAWDDRPASVRRGAGGGRAAQPSRSSGPAVRGEERAIAQVAAVR